MEKKIIKYIKIVITIAIPCLFIWFLIISPYLDFKKNEKTMEAAAERYFELNSDKLPTGKRVATVTLKKLFNDSYIKEDFYLPYTTEPCSVTESWVKVKKNDDNEYEYYTYLQCGVFKSSVDHKGPTITLNGKEEITINRGEEYKDPGIKSVKDNTDGKMDIDSVTIDDSAVDTNKNGTYEVTYTVLDSFKNKTTITRTVNVVQKLNVTVKKEASESGIYKGKIVNNYIYFSGMLFRIIGIDGENVKIVTANDIANVNYDGIDEWLDYFYEHISNDSKKYLVKNKYCYGDKANDIVSTNTECGKQTKERYVYILSSKELNESYDANKETYLFTSSISWTSSRADSKTAWAAKDRFFGVTSQYMSFSKEYNLGVRPVLTIKGNTLITTGDGSEENPYSISDIKIGKADEYLNTRYSGEYITYSGYTWRIIETDEDGTTKVVSTEKVTLASNNDEIKYDTTDAIKIYNPNQKGNVGYYINQKTGDTVNEKYFVAKEVTVPIYKTVAKYGKETETKKYKVKFAAPNMYEMFSAADGENGYGYWLINSSQEQYRKYMTSTVGVVYYDYLSDSMTASIRPVGYLDKKVKIVSGAGTKNDPYKISK